MLFVPHTFMPQSVGGAWTGPTSGIISQWWLDNSHVSGTTVTDSGSNNNTGTAGSGVSSTSSPSGAFYSTARALDGTINSVITLAADVAGVNWETGPMTFAMWVNVVDITAAGSGGFRATFFSSNDATTSASRVLNNTSFGAGVVGFETTGAGGVCTSAAQLVNNTWTHIGVTTTSSVFTVYINGSSVGTVAGTPGDTGANHGNYINGLNNGGGVVACAQGAMYNVVLYNRALSSGEMSTLFAAK